MTKEKAYVIMERLTYDGVRALLWNDGALTDRMGNGLRPNKKKLPGRVRLMEDATILTWDELVFLAKEAK